MYRPAIIDRGYFGIGIYFPKTEVNIGGLMRSAFCYGADFIFTVGKRYKHEATDTTWTARHIPLYHYGGFDDFFCHLPNDCPVIGVEEDKDAHRIDFFQHPERAIYLLGAEDTGIPPEIMKKCDAIVTIPFTKMCLNVTTAGSIIIHDRIMKRSRITIGRKEQKKMIREWETR